MTAHTQGALAKPTTHAHHAGHAAWCRHGLWRLASGVWLLAFTAVFSVARAQVIVMASTTSTEQSGLFAHLLPQFKKASGIDVKVVALGTGQALDMARRGDADVLFVHDKAAEEKMAADGFTLQRHDVMYNDFVLVGPKSDPAAAQGPDILQGLKRIAATQSAFISRGDKSGTHAAELRYWQLAGAAKGGGYRECGCGMGQALNIASSANAYALTDRGTWLAFRNRGDLSILVQGDTRLFNQYGVLVVNPAKHPHVKAAAAQAFVDWVTASAGQAAIAQFRIAGEPVFVANAKQRAQPGSQASVQR